jgi:hypothetical protein
MIYEARLVIDKRIQPLHGSDIDQLVAKVASCGRDHPYALKEADFDQLTAEAAYLKMCRGFPGLMDETHCYRISTVWKLQRNTEALVLRGLGNVTPEDGFTRISRQYDLRGEDWLALSRFIGGRYSGPRGATWWTTLELPGDNVQCAGHRMGLLNGDIALHAIVLRCRTDYIARQKLAFVPTVVDGFFFEIFQATADSESPRWGTTIDLEDPENLKAGVSEYVVPPLDIDEAEIQLMPINLTTNRSSHRVYHDDIADSLLAYYQRA